MSLRGVASASGLVGAARSTDPSAEDPEQFLQALNPHHGPTAGTTLILLNGEPLISFVLITV